MTAKTFTRRVFPILLLLAALVAGCSSFADPQSIATVPFGEPDFPYLGDYWVIDDADVLSSDTVQDVDRQFEHTRAAGFAEQVVVVMEGVSGPRNYSVQLLRHLKLGEAEGDRADNGMVWLVMPDQPVGNQIWYAVGTGLPEFTSFEAGAVIDAASVYAADSDWDAVVREIASVSDAQLREVYPELAVETEPLEEDVEIDPVTVMWIIIIIVAIVVIGGILYAIDPELGEMWFYFWLQIVRILAIAAGGGRSGGGSGSGSRSGR